MYISGILISADEHDQTSESPNAAAAAPPARRGPRRRRSSMPGRPSWTRSHPLPASVLPESAPRKGSALVRRAHIPDTYAAPGSEQQPGRIPIPGGGAAGDRGLRLGLPARRWRLRDACGLSRLNDVPAPWAQAHLPPCNRQVTSTSIHMARPDRLPLLTVTHRYTGVEIPGSMAAAPGSVRSGRVER
jgi:hypothetical protein